MRRTRWLLALGLVLLSPLCAEYLSGYDTSTGDPLALLGGLLIFCPLYGAPALLIRELSRRFGVGWPGILALATAFGILQAGVFDQSLFSGGYRGIDYWDELVGPTWIEPLGLGASPALTFLVGHAVWSFGIPIALVESLRPELSRQPWLRLPGLIVTTLCYLAAAALIFFDQRANERYHASAAQLVGSLVVVAGLAGFAFTVGRRRAPGRDGAVPRPLVVGVLGFVLALAVNLVPGTWPGVVVAVAIVVVCAAGVVILARSRRWTGRQVAALATGALLARAVVGFLAVPLGEVTPVAKYTHNGVFLLGAAILGWWAVRSND